MGTLSILLWGPDGQGWIVDVESSQFRGVQARAIDEVSWTLPSSPHMIERGRENSGSAWPKGTVLDPVGIPGDFARARARDGCHRVFLILCVVANSGSRQKITDDERFQWTGGGQADSASEKRADADVIAGLLGITCDAHMGREGHPTAHGER